MRRFWMGMRLRISFTIHIHTHTCTHPGTGCGHWFTVRKNAGPTKRPFVRAAHIVVLVVGACSLQMAKDETGLLPLGTGQLHSLECPIPVRGSRGWLVRQRIGRTGAFLLLFHFHYGRHRNLSSAMAGGRVAAVELERMLVDPVYILARENGITTATESIRHIHTYMCTNFLRFEHSGTLRHAPARSTSCPFYPLADSGTATLKDIQNLEVYVLQGTVTISSPPGPGCTFRAGNA